MKAARFYDRGDIRIEDIPEPEVTPGTVGIKVVLVWNLWYRFARIYGRTNFYSTLWTSASYFR